MVEGMRMERGGGRLGSEGGRLLLRLGCGWGGFDGGGGRGNLWRGFCFIEVRVPRYSNFKVVSWTQLFYPRFCVSSAGLQGDFRSTLAYA
jgi:hypothetical protein